MSTYYTAALVGFVARLGPYADAALQRAGCVDHSSRSLWASIESKDEAAQKALWADLRDTERELIRQGKLHYTREHGT